MNARFSISVRKLDSFEICFCQGCKFLGECYPWILRKTEPPRILDSTVHVPYMICPCLLYFIISNGIACTSKFYWKHERKIDWNLICHIGNVYRWIRWILFISFYLVNILCSVWLIILSLSLILPLVQDEGNIWSLNNWSEL